jgi:hypothetical protein
MVLSEEHTAGSKTTHCTGDRSMKRICNRKYIKKTVKEGNL